MLADIVGSIMISLKLVKLRALSARCDLRSARVQLRVGKHDRTLAATTRLRVLSVDLDTSPGIRCSNFRLQFPLPRCCRYFFSEIAVRIRVEREFAGASRSRLGVEREIRTMIRCGRYRRGRCHRRNAIPKQRRREGGVCHPRVFASGLKIAGAFFRYTGRRAASVARFDTDTGQRYSVSANESPFKDHVMLRARCIQVHAYGGSRVCAHARSIHPRRARARGGERGI